MRYEVILQALVELPTHDFRLEIESIPPLDLKLKRDIENSLTKKLDSVPGLGGLNTSVAIVSFG